MKEGISKLLHLLSWMSAAASLFFVVASAVCLFQGTQWAAGAMIIGSGVPFFLATALLVIMPSAVLYRRSKQRRDFLTLCISGFAFLSFCAVLLLALLWPNPGSSPAG